MKKLIISLLLLSLVLTFFASCGNTPEGENENTETDAESVLSEGTDAESVSDSAPVIETDVETESEIETESEVETETETETETEKETQTEETVDKSYYETDGKWSPWL